MARKKADEINLNGYQDSNYDNLTVSDTDYSECSVSGADNVLSESASDNKKVFDTFPKMIAAKFNGLIKKLKNGNFVQDENYVHTDNNYTAEDKAKLEGIAGGAQVNVIETVKVNGEVLEVSEKAVDVKLSTKLTEFNNDGNFVQDENYVHTDNNYTAGEKQKLEGIASGAQVNVIEKVKVNGRELGINKKGVDVSVPTKLTDLNNDGGFVRDGNYVHTDNNFDNECKRYALMVPDILTTANQSLNIALGANRGVSFQNYSDMIDFFNSNMFWGVLDDGTIQDYSIGQSIYIGTVDVPDLWIASLSNTSEYQKYTYVNDEKFIEDLNAASYQGEFLRVGYITLGQLETQKVDLGIFYTADETDDFFERKGRYASYIGDLHPTPNDVYQITRDTNIYLPALTSTVEEFYFSVDTKEGENEEVGPQIVFSLPEKFKWLTDVTFEPNRHYEIAIRGDCGVIADFGEVSE